jgi:hypothetical protein
VKHEVLAYVNRLQKASSQETRSEDIISSLPDLTKYDTFFSSLQKLGYDRVSNSLLEAATKLFIAIVNFLSVSLKFLDANIVLEAMKSNTGDNVTATKSALTKAFENLESAVNQEVLFDDKNRVWREECEKAMDFLSDLPVQKAHDDVRNLRMKNSGNWILENEGFQKWVKGEVKTVWCPGKRRCFFLTWRIEVPC